MIILDVHGLDAEEAIYRVLSKFDHLIKHGQRQRIDVIHGYGSSGVGGSLRRLLRETFDRCKIEYFCGELLDGNPGHTVVLVSENRINQQRHKRPKRE